MVPVGVKVGVNPMAVAVMMTPAFGPVTVLSQDPQLVAMNARQITGPANRTVVKMNFLLMLRDSFLILENMVSLFFCELMTDRMPRFRTPRLKKCNRPVQWN